jgi:hypothetical protein
VHLRTKKNKHDVIKEQENQKLDAQIIVLIYFIICAAIFWIYFISVSPKITVEEMHGLRCARLQSTINQIVPPLPSVQIIASIASSCTNHGQL